jgi:hypothetical protein
MDRVGAGELRRDLETGVAPTHNQHGPWRDVARLPVPRAVDLEDLRAELTGQSRRERQLERTGRHDDLVGPHCPIAAVELKPAVSLGQ